MAVAGAILVVDDQQNDVDLLLRTFKKLKVANRIDVCMSADEAIEYLTTRELPAVMLLDLKMPEKMASLCCAGSRAIRYCVTWS